MPSGDNAAVARIALDSSGVEFPVESDNRPLLLVLNYRGVAVGEVFLPPNDDARRHAPLDDLSPPVKVRVFRQQLIGDFRQATRGACPPESHANSQPTVSVVVTTKDRPDDLRACLESLVALRTTPDELLVIDGSQEGGRSRAVSNDYPARYSVHSGGGLTQARNQGIAMATSELVAFVEDDCRVDPEWLEGLGDAFGDPSLAAVVGYIGPLELETRSQWLFDAREAPRRRLDCKQLGGLDAYICNVDYRIAVCRKSALVEAGLFADDLGPGTPARSGHEMDLTYRLFASGYSVLVDPARIAWHRHPRSAGAVERALAADVFGGLAVASRCLITYRDPIASATAIRSTAASAWAVTRVLGTRERGSAWHVFGGALRCAARGRSDLLRALAPRPRKHASPNPISVPSSSPTSTAAIRREKPRLTVVVPSYNRRGPLRDALLSLSRQSYPPHMFEVVAVVDGSTDGSAELARSLDTPYELRVVEQENRGPASSRNRGAREAREELLVFLDDDLLPETQCLAAHVAGHESGGPEHVVLGSCPPVPRGGGLWPIYFRAIWDRHHHCKAERHHKWTYADIVSGSLSLTRSLVLDSGGWDERFSRREDWEFGLRLLRDGASFVYKPDARAWHNFESTLASELRNRQVEGRDDVYFASKHPRLKAQLPLAAYARICLSLKGRLAFRHRHAGERAVRAALPVASAVELLRLRRTWLRVVSRLLAHAYFLGIAESLGSPERLTEFLSPVVTGELVETLDVTLGREGCLQVPPTAGALDLMVRSDDEHPVRIPALEPEGQWEWGSLEERLLQEISSDAAAR